MKNLIISLKIFLFFTILTGIVYPLVVTGIVHGIFPDKANGSMVIQNSKTAGSQLIGQQFNSPKYFSSRPSVISYNPMPSGGSNFCLTSTKLKELVTKRKNQFILFNHLPGNTTVPSEMLFASSSGLDPHISPQAALLQADRVAKARNFNANQKKQVVQGIWDNTEHPQFLLLGEERVNVFLLNLSLDRIK
jgi:potassium-transporting ATPase KdpC subunit